MKKEMSSFDVRSVAAEMASLEGAHMDKIFQWGEGNVLFRINTKDGKRDLFFRDKKWLFLSPDRPDTPDRPTSFATFMRKHLANARVGRTEQAGFDRVVAVQLFKAEGEFQLIFELFGGGNVLLVRDGVIVNCLTQRTFRDRVTRPGEPYARGKPRFDPTSSTEEEFAAQFKTSDSDTVRTLATVTNLGGQYAEEVCARTGVDKSVPAKEVGDAAISEMHACVMEIVSRVLENPQPTLFLKEGRIVDIAPVDLRSEMDCEREAAPSMSEAVGRLLAQADSEAGEDAADPEIDRLRKRIAKQSETVEAYRQAAEGLKAQADTLYTEYGTVSEILEVLRTQSAKLTWEKLTEGALKIPAVDYIEPDRSTVAVKVGMLSVPLDYTKSLDANASDIYARGKAQGEKAASAESALEDSRAELAEMEEGFKRRRAEELGRAKPTKRFWFEAYKWFVTSGGRLCIGGRDARSNDQVVKKHLKEGDVYAHADIHGAPSVILKDGAGSDAGDLREACWFALAHSKAWTAGSVEGGSFWAYPDQVSKTPNAGEFVPRGAFIIRGKRNYEFHIPLEMALGEMFYSGERKVMCAPTPVFEKLGGRYFVIRPSKSKSSRVAGEIAKALDVPEEEVSRILPPGSAEVAGRVWPGEEERK